MQRLRFPLALLAVLLALAPFSVFAQGFQVGSIAGTVTDNTGGALPGVTITVTNTERGVTRSDVTDSQGRYRFAALPIGPYRVEAILEGFQKSTNDNVQVQSEKSSLVDLTLGLAATADQITVTAEAPVVDPTNVTQTTNISTAEFEKAPVGRSYQSIIRLAPGVVGGSNPNSNGALSSSNQYLFDGIDTTDPTTGTFGSNLNFEAIQEVNVLTTAISAEYGRVTGAVVNVITKSGTNEFSGSLKAIAINDEWNGDNKVYNTLTGASLQRTVVDHDNIRYGATLGGPIWKDRAWFFGSYDEYETLGSYTTTVVSGEEWSSNPYQQYEAYRVTAQITPSHQIFGKYGRDPYTGIVRGDYGSPYNNGDLYSIHTQDQGGNQYAIQYTGVLGSKMSAEAMVSKNTSMIIVGNYRSPGPFDNGSAVFDQNTGRYLNGSFFSDGDGTDRPRRQYNAAMSYFASSGSSTHDLKVGIDRQEVESSSHYSYTNNRLYDIYLNPDYTMDTTQDGIRYDFTDSGAQTSSGTIDSLYLRDKMNFGRFYLEAGVRYEMQDGQNDIGADIVDATSLAPRLSGSFDLKGDGRSLVTGSAGRFYDFIIQGFIDGFAQTVQRGVYDIYNWDIATQQWIFAEHIDEGGGSISPNLGLDAPYVDEFTVGFQQQLGPVMGVGARVIYRKWGQLIDDRRTFVNGAATTNYYNSDDAERSYKALQLSFDKRFANNWSLLANYTYSKAEGNHFGSTTSSLENFAAETCRLSDGTILPCSDVIASVSGNASYDFPHVVKALGLYSRPIGPINLTVGLGGEFSSGQTYSRTATANVLRPGTSTASGQTLTYYYDGIGSERLDSTWTADASLEATYAFFRGMEIGLKGEVFNIADNQKEIGVASQLISSTSFGQQTSLTHYQSPRNFRLTALFRF